MSTQNSIAVTELQYEARTNSTGEWAIVAAWSVIAEIDASYGPAPVRHTYNVRTPADALDCFKRESAQQQDGLGTVVRIIPDPNVYTQQIRIIASR